MIEDTSMMSPMDSAPNSASSTSEHLHDESHLSKYIRKGLNIVDGMVYIPPRVDVETTANEFMNGLRFLTSVSIYRWTQHFFQCTFTAALLNFLLFYFVIILIFTFLIVAASEGHYNNDRQCVGEEYPYNGLYKDKQEFAFSLSWTTFSTVGYGTISPPAELGCRGMRYLLAAEAFFGVLYAGFCGAIFYSKVSRINAMAHVTFSSGICLQYGDGITHQKRRHYESIHEKEQEQEKQKQDGLDLVGNDDNSRGSGGPFPYIEFQIVNDRAGKPLSAILDCGLKCFITKVHVVKDHDRTVENSLLSRPQVYDWSDDKHTVVHETYNMPINFQNYPYLTTSIDVRSILNEHSPLLNDSVRERIKQVGGWPQEYNSHEAIRNCLCKSIFQILIKFEGSSHVTCTQVFAMKEYRLEDIYVGWKFANVLRLTRVDDKRKKNYHSARGVTVDQNMTHFIMPQHGGGHEPIKDREIEKNVLRFLERNDY